MFGSNTGYLGVDIEPDRISVVQLVLEKKLTKPKLVNYGEIPIDRHATVREHSHALQQLIKGMKATSQRVVCSLSNRSTTVHQIKLPYNIAEKEIPTLVKQKARQEIGEHVTTMAVGWSILEHYIRREKDLSVNEAESAWNVLFVATPMEDIQHAKELTRKAKLSLIAPEIKAAALARVADTQGKKKVAIIHAESDWHIDIMTLRNRMLENAGSLNSIIEAIPVIQELWQQGEWSFQASGSGAPIIIEHLQGEALQGIQIEPLNPWKGMLVPNGLEERLRIIGPTMAVATGLALREIIGRL